MSEDVLRLLAAAEDLAVESDAPEHVSGVPYDVGLQADLEEHGPDALKQWGKIVIRDCSGDERTNSVLWYAAKWGLNHDRIEDVLVLTDPMRDEAGSQ